jgi:hypothetical protein
MNLMTAHHEYMTRPDDERFETLDALHTAVNNRRTVSRSYVGNVQRLRAIPTDGNGLQITAGPATLTPTHHAFNQLSNLVGAPAHFLRSLPNTTAALAINDCLARPGTGFQNGDIKLLATVEELPRLRGISSPTYGRIWDSEVVEAAMRFVDRCPEFHNPPDWSKRPSGLYASDRDVFIFLINGGSMVEEPMHNGRTSALHRGVILKNSEVGAGAAELMTFWFRVVCGNHIVWDASGVSSLRIPHRKFAPSRFDRDLLPTLTTVNSQDTARPMLDAIKRAQNFLLPATVEERMEFIRTKGSLTKHEAERTIELAQVEEGDARTLWQVVQGATAYARTLKHTDTRVDLEERAGSLMRLAA